MSPVRSPGPEDACASIGPVARAALLEERAALDAVGEPPQGHAPVLQVGDHRRRDPGVVVDDLGLGGARLGIQHLVEVGELQPAALDLDRSGAARRGLATAADLRFAALRLGPWSPWWLGACRPAARAASASSAASSSSRAAGRLGGRVARAGRLGVANAGLQRGHEVDHLVLGRRGGRGHELLAGRLAVDQVEHLVAVAVLVALGLERLGERLDQLAGHGQLAVAHVDVVAARRRRTPRPGR